eukprot:753975-Hanusia_phi.AAC.3
MPKVAKCRGRLGSDSDLAVSLIRAHLTLLFQCDAFFCLKADSTPYRAVHTKQKMSEIRHYGGPFKKKFKEYEQPWYISKFENVKNCLIELDETFLAEKEPQAQSRYLAHVTAILEQASDDLFGLNAPKENQKLMPKLPSKLFSDFQIVPQGGLLTILSTAFRYKKEKGWSGDSFEEIFIKDETKAQEHTALFLRIESSLLNAGLLRRPKVLFSLSMPRDQLSELNEIVLSHKGAIVTRREQATHEVFPDEQQDEADADYCRTIDSQDHMSKVHWWYFPDSYQEWKPSEEIQGDPEPPIPTPLVWKITARFLRDLEKFNEWMNEEDYILTGEGEPQEDAVAASEVGSKRKRDTKSSKASKREDKQQETPHEETPQAAAPSGVFKPAPSSLGKLQTGATRAQMSLENFIGQSRMYSNYSNKPEPIPAREPTGAVVLVPSYASWFKMEQIHPIERKALPEWFASQSGSKTPKNYVEARDLIINLYRESPSKYITATECRRHLAIDVCAVMRLHAFLEHWGLINYNISVNDRPVAVGPMDTSGHPILIAMPDGSLVPKEKMDSSSQGLPNAPAPQLSTHANIYAAPARAKQGEKVTKVDRACHCTRERFHCISKPDLAISPGAYFAQKYPTGLTSADFVRVTEGQNEEEIYAMSDWTETETLRLLEGIEQFGEDWKQVASHVETKTKEQVRQSLFLQSCIELQCSKREEEHQGSESGDGASLLPLPEHQPRGGEQCDGSSAAGPAQGRQGKLLPCSYSLSQQAESPQISSDAHASSNRAEGSKEAGLLLVLDLIVRDDSSSGAKRRLATASGEHYSSRCRFSQSKVPCHLTWARR